ncbi:glycoside hydrolase family 3 N-terminal domain-containing protein [Microbacterium karelineae]|uniref:beta-xylosidase/alpha-l-arabinosidase n=1 Tax=Microbacterium karelineae TaxID=2654283 RepID=UPI0012E9A71B|nr:glycoside hydrolase family 3 N-terminal domain-containing protein [Microbacterium karelineae]
MSTLETADVPAMPTVSDRVQDILDAMTLEEKAAQIVGYWLDQGGEVVAPMADEMATSDADHTLAEITRHGIGHYTRVYGTRPVEPAQRAAWLREEQRRLVRETRLGIPAIVHEECLTGLAAWRAATFPTPLAWGASFDPDLVEEMAASIGDSMRELGVHQGLAPVLDVIRDPRWGRVDECIAEDPYVVGTIGTAFVRGLQGAGVHATLKHFLGYSGSQAGRNHAPVHAGPREVADVFVPPFEMAIRDGGVKSVMNSYAEIDGLPVASQPELLTRLLRDELGFDGVVVADYFAVAFLEVMHAVAADRGEAAQWALEAGIDVELPSGDAYLAPLVERVRSGRLDEAFVDRAVLRVLAQKEELGLLEPGAFDAEAPSEIDLDTPRHRDIARRLAAESVVMLSNDGVLPLAGSAHRVAVIGPNADRPEALQGCYSFANHVLGHHPDHEIGFEIPTVAEALAAEAPHAEIVLARGCEVEGEDRSGIDEAVSAASGADVAIVVVGDQAGLFGRGSVGEGNDTASLDLPGVQRELVERVAATGTPVVMVLLTGRPYAVDWALDGSAPRPGAVLQSFFPGEEGGTAIAQILTGSASPSGRLPVSLPRAAGAQPYSYLRPILGGPSSVTSTNPTPVRPFGFGLGYATFAYDGFACDAEASAGGAFEASVTVTNTSDVAGADVVQLYARDVVASVTRPVAQLLGYARVDLAPGQSLRVTFDVPSQRLAFSDRRMVRVVEPGDVEVWVGSHAEAGVTSNDADETTGGVISNERATERTAIEGTATPRRVLRLTGPVHEVRASDSRLVGVRIA